MFPHSDRSLSNQICQLGHFSKQTNDNELKHNVAMASAWVFTLVHFTIWCQVWFLKLTSLLGVFPPVPSCNQTNVWLIHCHSKSDCFWEIAQKCSRQEHTDNQIFGKTLAIWLFGLNLMIGLNNWLWWFQLSQWVVSIGFNSINGHSHGSCIKLAIWTPCWKC